MGGANRVGASALKLIGVWQHRGEAASEKKRPGGAKKQQMKEMKALEAEGPHMHQK